MGLTMSEAQRMLARMNEGFAAAADMIGGLLTAWEESQHAIATWQAECARLRDSVRALRTATANLAFEARDRDEFEAAARACDAALASAPGGKEGGDD